MVLCGLSDHRTGPLSADGLLPRDMDSSPRYKQCIHVSTLIKKRSEEVKLSRAGQKANEEHLDTIQGLLSTDLPQEEATPIRHAHRVLRITFASSAVSSVLILHTIHQTFQTPQYIPGLREEIRKALNENDGWTGKALLEMRFLDSYIRDMLRLCPPSVCEYFCPPHYFQSRIFMQLLHTVTGQRTIVSPS